MSVIYSVAGRSAMSATAPRVSHADARHRRDRGADYAVEQPPGLSEHPRTGAGSALVADLLRGSRNARARGLRHDLSGYLGSPGQPAWSRILSRAPRLATRSLLIAAIPCSAIATAACSSRPTSAAGARPIVPARRHHHPNHFEFEWLCGAKATTSGQVIAAAQALMARGPSTVIVTSAELTDTPDGEIRDPCHRTVQGGLMAWRTGTPKLPISPNGTGDLFAALFVAARVRRFDTPNALATPCPPSSPCWSAPPRAEPRKCASSRAPIAYSPKAPVRAHRRRRLKAAIIPVPLRHCAHRIAAEVPPRHKLAVQVNRVDNAWLRVPSIKPRHNLHSLNP
jgi:pyridoxal/pyridoxine/pyridoxamine kinase